jgi:hypothetical protein
MIISKVLVFLILSLVTSSGSINIQINQLNINEFQTLRLLRRLLPPRVLARSDQNPSTPQNQRKLIQDKRASAKKTAIFQVQHPEEPLQPGL